MKRPCFPGRTLTLVWNSKSILRMSVSCLFAYEFKSAHSLFSNPKSSGLHHTSRYLHCSLSIQLNSSKLPIMYLPFLSILYLLVPCAFANGCYQGKDNIGCPTVVSSDVFTTAIADFCNAHFLVPNSAPQTVPINVGNSWPGLVYSLPVYTDHWGTQVSLWGKSIPQKVRLTSKGELLICTSCPPQPISGSIGPRTEIPMCSITPCASRCLGKPALAMVQRASMGPIADIRRHRRLEGGETRILVPSLLSLSVRLWVPVVYRGI